MIQHDRAGTPYLKKYFQEKLEALRTRRLIVIERLGRTNELTAAQQATYYSSWIYSAIHIGLTIPELQNTLSLSAYLGLPLSVVVNALEYLESIGLCFQSGENFITTKNLVRLSKESNNINKHHTNWRLRAIDSLESDKENELHYSAIISASPADIIQIKDQILENLISYLAQNQKRKIFMLFVLIYLI